MGIHTIFHRRDIILEKLNISNNDLNDVNDIINTMSKEDRKSLNLSGNRYRDNPLLVKRFIKKVNGEPVAFFDIVGDKSGVAVTVGTRSGDKYRHKGYGKDVAKQGKKWLDAHSDDFEQIVWWVRKDNIRSIKIAEYINFELDESSVLPDNPMD